MGWTSMRKLREVIANVRAVLAVELLVAAQALDFRAGIASPGAGAGAAHAVIRSRVPTMDADREVAEQIAAVDALLPEVVAAAEGAVGGLAWRSPGLVRRPARDRPGRRHRRPGGLDGGGWWAVVLGFEGDVTCARFDETRGAAAAAPWPGVPARRGPPRCGGTSTSRASGGSARGSLRARTTRSTSAGCSRRGCPAARTCAGSPACSQRATPRRTPG